MTSGAGKKNGPSSAGDLLAILRLCVAVGGAIVLASAVTIAVVLLPDVVHNTTVRVWIGIGLFGVVVAGLSALGIYVSRAVGEETLWRWLRGASSRDKEPPY